MSKFSLEIRDDKIIDSVKDDIEERKIIGQQTYGTTLETAKIDSLQYAYEEVLDLAIYLKSEIINRDTKLNK